MFLLKGISGYITLAGECLRGRIPFKISSDNNKFLHQLGNVIYTFAVSRADAGFSLSLLD